MTLKTLVASDYSQITKTCLREGGGLEKPLFASKCVINLSKLKFVNHEILKEKVEQLVGCKTDEETEAFIGFGMGELSDVVDTCVEQMKVGEISSFDVRLNKDLDTMKKDDCLSFEISLISASSILEVYERPFGDTLDLVLKLKDKASCCFKSAKTFTASVLYVRAIRTLIAFTADEEMSDDEKRTLQETKNILHLNIAACQLKRKLFSEAAMNCSSVLSDQPDSLKGLYRRGKAFLMLNDLEEAEKDISKLADVHKDSKASKELLELLHKKQTSKNRMYASRLHQMFSAS